MLSDREELRGTAMTRARRGRLLVIITILVSLLAGAAVVGATHNGNWTASRIVVFLIPFTVLAVLLVALYPITRRRDREAALVFGADTATRRAVRRALRDGQPPDARTDALARDLAIRTLRNAWQVKLFIGLMALQILAGILRAIGGADLEQNLLSALVIACFGVNLAILVVNRRRCRAYLAHHAEHRR